MLNRHREEMNRARYNVSVWKERAENNAKTASNLYHEIDALKDARDLWQRRFEALVQITKDLDGQYVATRRYNKVMEAEK